jgi:hypothetical protein
VAQIPYPAINTINTPISSFFLRLLSRFQPLGPPAAWGRRGGARRSPVGSPVGRRGVASRSPVGRQWVEGASWPRRRCSGLGTASRAAASIGRSTSRSAGASLACYFEQIVW